MSERQILFDNVNIRNKEFRRLNDLEKCKFLMTNDDTIGITAEFISNAFTKKQNLQSEPQETCP